MVIKPMELGGLSMMSEYAVQQIWNNNKIRI